jgi:putative ABC transport system permease protein
MGILRRLRAFAGPWGLVGLLVAVMIAAGATIVSFRQHLDDRALQASVEEAGYLDRDLFVSRTTRTGLREPPRAEHLHREVIDVLPATLAEVVEETWVYQRTEVSQLEGLGASLGGPGVTSEPAGFLPVVSLHSQSAIEGDATLVEGRWPSNPGDEGLEIAVSAAVAETLGLEVGEDYVLAVGLVGRMPEQVNGSGGFPIHLTGTFEPLDAQAPAWDHAPLLLEAGLLPIIQELGGDQPRAVRAGLLTDAEGIQVLSREGMTTRFAPQTVVRLRLDAEHLDAAWAETAGPAIARFGTEPSLFDARLSTGLPAVLQDVDRGSTALQVLVALVTAAILGVGAGLLALTAGLMVERRRREVHLLRARGARFVRVAVRMLVEAMPVVALAATLGWMAQGPFLELALQRSGTTPGVPTAVAVFGPREIAISIVGLLAIPAAALFVARGSADDRARDVVRRRPSTGRLTVEAAVVLLAVVGVVVVRQRGIAGPGGVDPFLAAVPLLVALATGLVVLRLYPVPLRWLEPGLRRRSGAVGFVAVTRAGRAAAGTARSSLVLVVAGAAIGLAGAMLAAVADGSTVDASASTIAFREGLEVIFAAVAVLGIVAVLLAGAMLVVMPAAARARDLGLLRSMGLPTPQARTLIVLEILPPLVLPVAVGVMCGMALPAVFGPALGLSALFAGVTPAVTIAPWLLAVLTGGVVLLVLLGTARAFRSDVHVADVVNTPGLE